MADQFFQKLWRHVVVRQGGIDLVQSDRTSLARLLD